MTRVEKIKEGLRRCGSDDMCDSCPWDRCPYDCEMFDEAIRLIDEYDKAMTAILEYMQKFKAGAALGEQGVREIIGGIRAGAED